MVFLSDNVNNAFAGLCCDCSNFSLHFFMKRTLVFLIPLLSLCVCLYTDAQAQRCDSLVQHEAPGVASRSPELAGTLSWVLPGLGQIYNGKVGKGLLQMELFFGGIGMIASSHIGFSHGSITPAAWISVGIVAGTFVWAVIDAVTTAERINGAAKGEAQLLQIRPNDCAIRFDLGATELGARASLVVDF